MPIDGGVLESDTPFAESIIWKLNRKYYQEAGISAWSDGVVPHSMTSNAFVGKTYAALILGFLKDLRSKHQKVGGSFQHHIDEKVYIIELGTGHGRLGFHILQQLDYLIELENLDLPEYCLVLTDIVESNLNFLENHPQFEKFIQEGKLEIAYYDGTESDEIVLRNSGKIIKEKSLSHPILVLANYFFDSIPNDLYEIEKGTISPCNLTVYSETDLEEMSPKDLLKNLKTTIHPKRENYPIQSPFINDLLSEYTNLGNTYVLMPRLGIQCIDQLQQFSKEGLMLVTIDKGFSDLDDLKNKPQPEIITHGSFSLYVNFHALGSYCEHLGGKPLFSSYSDFSLTLGCLMFLDDADSYVETSKAYEHYINDFGPDDYLGIKKFLLKNKDRLSTRELISSLRLGHYDSNLFSQLLPYIKHQAKQITIEEHKRLAETLNKVGANYFAINEHIDVNYEIGGLLYDLGLYVNALQFFNDSELISGELADIYYNKILCYYQLRQDEIFTSTLKKAKLKFPEFKPFAELEKLDLTQA